MIQAQPSGSDEQISDDRCLMLCAGTSSGPHARQAKPGYGLQVCDGLFSAEAVARHARGLLSFLPVVFLSRVGWRHLREVGHDDSRRAPRLAGWQQGDEHLDRPLLPVSLR